MKGQVKEVELNPILNNKLSYKHFKLHAPWNQK